jgi:hypothetical protein
MMTIKCPLPHPPTPHPTHPPTCNDCHWVDLLIDQLLRLPQKLTRQDNNRCGAIPHLIVLDLADVCERVRSGSEGVGE